MRIDRFDDVVSHSADEVSTLMGRSDFPTFSIM